MTLNIETSNEAMGIKFSCVCVFNKFEILNLTCIDV